MHNVAGRLTSLHDQLNQYVYLTENLNELRTNVEQIKVMMNKNRQKEFDFILIFRHYIQALKKKKRLSIILLNELILSILNLLR
jgi:hypothetical protein